MKRLLHKIPIPTLKRLLRFRRRLRALARGDGVRVFAISALATAAALLLAVWGATALNRMLERKILRTLIENFPSVSAPGTVEIARGLPKGKAPGEDLIMVSFHDLFSGVGWINQDLTTMYQDHLVTALMFPPLFEWEPISLPRTNAGALVRGPNLIGEVKKIGDRYFGLVSKSDGTPIFTEANTPIVSKYPGTLGFGGEENDFLVVYGAYEGLAFRIRGAISPIGPISPINLSEFFGIRVMNGGFDPRIARAPVLSHKPSVIGHSWYVWSATEGNPKLVKLFTDDADDIIGAVDLTEPIGPVRPTGLIRSIGLIGQGDDGRTYRFIDRGFATSAVREVVSVNLSVAPAAVRRAVISEVDPAEVAERVVFYLSNNGTHWIPAKVGEEVIFPDASGQQLLWKAVFDPARFRDVPGPFFTRVKLDYRIKFL